VFTTYPLPARAPYKPMAPLPSLLPPVLPTLLKNFRAYPPEPKNWEFFLALFEEIKSYQPIHYILLILRDNPINMPFIFLYPSIQNPILIIIYIWTQE
jgi:hypothetical protein